ncbi:MAG TPA: LLM class flavin-dependent oxidoreductase [Anaerolineaceae bacterium]|nr:LLM class flavin-dependent oxidoreductase [Anaerolineaceae bacterium]
MLEKLRFGIFFPQILPIPQMIEQCQFVETLGYDSLWIGDQFYNPLRLGDPMWEAWTLLAAIATQTSRIRLGTLVTNFIYRNPALVASQALTVDHLSAGRLELGLGAGFSPKDHSMTGSEPWKPRERIQRFGEAVQIIDRMLRNEVTTFEGQYYRIKDAIMSPRPVQNPRPPLTLGVTGPRAMRIAAAYADCWNTLDISVAEYSAGKRILALKALEACRTQQETFDEYCVSLGRCPRDIRRSLLVGYAADAPTSSLDEIKDYVCRYHEIGISEFIFFWIPDEYREIFANRISGFDRAMVERVAAQSLPAWRK